MFFTSEQPRGTKCRHSLERVLFLACNSVLHYFPTPLPQKEPTWYARGPSSILHQALDLLCSALRPLHNVDVPAQPIVIETEFSELTENLLRCQTTLSLLWKEKIRIIKLNDTEGTQSLDPFTKPLRPVPSLVNTCNC